jgi:hypothetical protein
VVLLDAGYHDPPELQIFDTEQGATTELIRTSFHFSTAHRGAYEPHLLIEPCGCIPSQDELTTAPFYPDRSQRMLAVYFDFHTCYAINVELLLELARERKGQDVRWRGWGAHTIKVHGIDNRTGLLSVSGCRLFSTMSDFESEVPPVYLQVHDFSHVGRGKRLCTLDRVGKGRGTRQFPPSLERYKLPRGYPDSWPMRLATGHDSLVFRTVSIPIFLFTAE